MFAAIARDLAETLHLDLLSPAACYPGLPGEADRTGQDISFQSTSRRLGLAEFKECLGTECHTEEG